MGKTAIIIGATGLTGNLLLQNLLKDSRYEQIKLFSRRSIGIKHSKIIEKTGDLIELDTFKNDFIADEVYCCIGTTAKKTPDKKIYRKIDFGIPVIAAKLCKDNNIDTFLVISSLGANSESTVFYSKTKGEMEYAVLKEKIPNTYILRPSIILGLREESRLGENIGKGFLKTFQFLFFGGLKKYKPIEARTIVKAMILLANTKPKTKISIIESDKIEEIAARNY